MIPGSITASQVVKKVISTNSDLHPIGDGFNINKLKEEVAKEISRINLEKISISDEEDLDKIISLFKKINTIYEDAMLEIEEILHEINLNNISVIEEILKFINFDFCSVTQVARKSQKKSSSFKLSEETELTNIWGDKIGSNDAVDISVDVANQIIQIALEYNNPSKSQGVSKNGNEIFGLCRKLFMYTNIIVVLKDTVNSYLHEFIKIEFKNDAIKFSNYPAIYGVLKHVGKERYRSHIAESFMYLNEIMDFKSFVPDISILGNKLHLNVTTEEQQNRHSAINSGALDNYLFYLNNIKIKELNNLVIQDIFRIVTEMQFAFQQINFTGIVENVVNKQSSSFIPIKIEKKALLDFLCKVTGIGRTAIEKVLGLLSSNLTTSIDLWNTPLLSYANYYYFAFASLSFGHVIYLMQRVLDKALDKQSQYRFFIQLIEIEFSNLGNGYKFEHIKHEKVSAILEGLPNRLMLMEMKDNLVVLHPLLFKFPLNSVEYGNAFEEALVAAEELNTWTEQIILNVESFTNLKNPEVVKIVLTNYPVISGTVIEGCHVMDFTLLSNYLSTGRYQRGKVLVGEGETKIGEVLAYNYYNDEQEFNQNLRRFCYEPDPIFEIVNRCKVTEHQLAKDFLELKIFVNGIEQISDTSIAFQNIKKIEYFLRQLFYFRKTLKLEESKASKEFIEGRFLFLMPQTFSLIAFDNTDRYLRVELIKVFENAGLTGISYLIFLLNHLSRSVAVKKIKKFKEHAYNSHKDYQQVEADLKTLIEKAKEQGVNSISHAKIEHDFSDERIEDIVQFLIDVLGSFEPKYCSIDELDNQLFFIIILCTAVAGNDKYNDYLTKAFLNFIDLLNYNFLYQKARDVAEEILMYSFKNEKAPIIGWLCLLKCYTKQDNICESLCYASLIFSVVEPFPEIDDYLYYDCFFTIMLLYREMGNTEALDEVFDILKKGNLSEYDSQKIHLSYYNSILQRDTEDLIRLIPEAQSYLQDNVDSILSYGQQGALPWAAFVLNVVGLIEKDIIDDNPFWQEIVIQLKEVIDEGTFTKLKAQFVIDEIHSIALFREALVRLFETRSYHDLSYEIKNLKLLANNIAETAISKFDYELLLLCGLLLNDQTLSFQGIMTEGQSEFKIGADKNYLERLGNYGQYIKDNIKLKEGQLLLWIFNLHSNVFALTITGAKEFDLTRIDKWDVGLMDRWVKAMSSYYFPDKGEYSINAQEDDYINILKSVASFNIKLPTQVSELLIYSSLKLGEYPFNLITGELDKIEVNLDRHERKVKDYVTEQNQDFISYHKPIVNVISLEWFIENSEAITLEKEQFTIEAWTPVEDEDFVLQLTYEKLKPILEEKFNSKIYTSRLPDKKLSSTINVFLAHGGKDFEGFKTIYTRENNGAAIVKEAGVSELFGSGVIAIVFVCNSGFIAKRLFSERLASFTQQVLSLGYKAVIAPAWALNPDIVPVWVDFFLSNLKEGQFIGQAVFNANVEISKVGYTEYSGFYSPTGWPGMHLYGNPNIRFTL